ncbi:unnamed protein product [Meloidogyne enterolobii]|uniref:Uncharacterized protein n=1 Tax=Meloidogyne enterolobii TaxID=390850 RepID=A0ACB1A502_MELEN
MKFSISYMYFLLFKKEDLNGAIQGLLRLQDTYKLKTKDLANGLVENININKQMDGNVCKGLL